MNRLRDIWTSLLYHIRNIHQWSDASSSYNSSAHRPLTIRETVAKRWLTGSSAAYAALQNIILDPRLLNDMPNLVWFKHSGNIKVYHNLLCKYCPKRLSFSYEGIYARTQLAVLDHNCNIDRKQAVNNRNELQTKTQYSKMSGQWVAKKVMEKSIVDISQIL